MIQFHTPYGETAPKGSKQVFTKPSMTEPDNTMSIPEIIARYTRGQGIAVNQNPWQQGVAQEEGEQGLTDLSLEQVLEVPVEPAKPEPSQEPAPAPAPVPTAAPAAEPAPAPAPAGA